MTYAIANVVYGIDLTYDENWLKELPKELEQSFDDNPENIGITTDYSGNGERPMWFGIKLCEFDECQTIRLDEIAKYNNPTDEIKQKWAKKVENLDPELHKILIDHFGRSNPVPDGSGGHSLRPEVLIIWSSS